jgi:preprotein translocase subunit YajC
MALIAVPMADSGGGAGVTFLIPLLLIIGMIWFMSRSQRRQRQRQEAVVSALNPGTRVLTSSGMAGTVRAVEDEFIVLEVSPGVEVRYVRQAIGRVLDDPETALGEPAAEQIQAGEQKRPQDAIEDKPQTPPTHTEN